MTLGIDVVVITKNSVEQFEKPALFNKVLESIFREIPVHKLVVVDGYSTDDTIEIVKQYTSCIIQDHRGRGKAREIGIRQVETEWFAFVDSDVMLCPNWFREIRKSIAPKVGIIHSLVLPHRYTMNFCRSMAFLRRKKLEEYLLYRQSKVALTMALLIRKELVKDISIPVDLHVREDKYIRDWVVKKGYEYIVSSSAKCWNLPRKKSFRKKGLQDGIISRRYKYIDEKMVWRNAFLAFPKAFLTVLYTRDWYSARNHLDWYLYWLKGYYYEKFKNS